MANILSQTIEQISKEKGIEPEVIQHALEDAMVAAAKKYFKTAEELQARYDPETGTIDVFAVKQIVETVTNPETEMSLEEALSIDESFQVGEFVEIPKPTVELGRIAAQTAKQVIFQKVREAEREIVFDEFSGQVGQLVNGIVRRFEGRDIILDMGKTEALASDERAIPHRAVQTGRPCSGGDREGPQVVERTADRRFPHRPQPAGTALRDGNPGGL